MSKQKNDACMDIVALVMAALIVLLMFTMTEAGASHGHLLGNLVGTGSPGP